MAMIESVQARHQGSHDFEGYYSQLCALQDTCPLTSVKAHLSEGALDLNADRIRLPDWAPILNALRINKSLEFVGIRSYFQQSGQDGSGKKFKTGRRPPPIRSKDVSYRLSVALRESLVVTHALKFLELQGIPLRRKDMQALTTGIVRNNTLQHLSLEGCRIGDRGLMMLTNGLKHSPGITSLNVSACGVTTSGAEFLAKLIKHQSTKRHSEAWKDSLRYRRPDLDRMSGIRRITLNANPLICDDGAMAFADALRDDLWLKALDLQQCGISNIGAKAFLDALHENSTIVVLDIRKNPLVDHDLLKAVMEQVMINGGGQQNQYKWLHTSPPKQRSKPKRLKIKPLSNTISKKASKRASTAPSKSTSRSRSPGGALVKVVPENYKPPVTKPGPGFVPWRTAARASQRSMAIPIDQIVQVDSSSGPSGSTTPTKSGATSIHVHAVSSTPSSDQDTSHKDTSAATPTTMISSVRELEERDAMERRRIKDMQVEVEELRRRLYIESRARAAADARVVELEVDNSRLKHHIQLLEARSPGSPLRMQPVEERENGVSELDDESVLDSIEESFQKFHAFLDLLREAGLGQLCNLVGLGPQDLKSPRVASILQSHQPFDQAGPSGTHAMGRPPSGHRSYPNHTAGHPSSVHPPSDRFAPQSQAHPSTTFVPSVPAPTHLTDVIKQHERTAQQNGIRHVVAETDTVRGGTIRAAGLGDKEPDHANDANNEPRRDGTSQELRIIHSKPLVSPPEPSGMSQPQTSLGTNVFPINTQANNELNGVYQQASMIGTQDHPPHASLLPPTSSQPVVSQGSTIPTTQPVTQPLRTHSVGGESTNAGRDSVNSNLHPRLDSKAAETQKLPAEIQTVNLTHRGDDSTLKDLLLSKPKYAAPNDSTGVTVGSTLSFTNPERPQLMIGSELGAGDAKHFTKATDEGEQSTVLAQQKNGSKETPKGSASEEDYEDDFMPSSDTGSNSTPRNISNRTSTPSKSSVSHRTYTRSSGTGSDHSAEEDVKSLGSSIPEDIGESPPPNQGDAKQKSDDTSDEDF